MSIECGECERDLRGGHDPACSRYRASDESFEMSQEPWTQPGKQRFEAKQKTLTIANETDQEVTYTITPVEWTGADSLEPEEP